jgi:hypothetical protein
MKGKSGKDARRAEGAPTEGRDRLARIEELLTALVKLALKETLREELSNPKAKTIYQRTGQSTRPQLEKLTKFSGGKISGLWQRWEQLGLLIKDGKSYRRLI